MIKRLLRSIRQKPKGVRDQVAMVIAVVVTGTVFTVWLVNAPARLASYNSNTTNAESESTGFADIFEGFGEVIDQSRATNEVDDVDLAGEDDQSEPSLAEMVQMLEEERAARELVETSTTSTSTPVAVWNSMPTTSNQRSEREVMIIPVQSQATSSDAGTEPSVE